MKPIRSHHAWSVGRSPQTKPLANAFARVTRTIVTAAFFGQTDMPIVYIASTADGKVYIGCTTKGLDVRKGEHSAAAATGSPYKFHKAIREKGMAAFTWRIVGNYKNTQDMYAAERATIARYNSYRNGYNSSPGGKGSKADGMRARAKGYYPAPSRRLYTRSR